MSPRQANLTVTRRELTYADYLGLDQLLSAQHPRVDPPHHDELLFIVCHQVTELWLKLLLHELRAVRRWLRADRVGACLDAFERSLAIQTQLVDQWSVLETLTASQFARIRPFLGSASGLQSAQYRELEVLLGKRDGLGLAAFHGDPDTHAKLTAMTREASLFDELLRYLRRDGYALPDRSVARDWSKPRRISPAVSALLRAIAQDPREHRHPYLLCRALAEFDANLRRWRIRHMRTAAKVIGGQPGTGGTNGVPYLERRVERLFFPELGEATQWST